MSIPLLFSFGFTSPAMLAWGVAIALPVLIHLWRRRHSREEPWGPMRLLEEAIGRSRRRLQIERGFLLLLRMILILLLVLAVAEPVADTSIAASMAPDARAHRVIVVDGSFSMAYRPTDRSRFDRAKEIIHRIVQSGRPGDGYSLVVGGSPTEVVIADPVFETSRFSQVVDQLRQPDMTLDAINLLAAVQKVLQRGKATRYEFDRTEIYFLTDLDEVGWKIETKALAKTYRKLAAKLSGQATIVLLDLGQADATNGSITSLYATPSATIVGQAVELHATLQHFGPTPPKQSRVELFVDGRAVKHQGVQFDKTGQATATFSYSFTAPGLHDLELRLQADQLEVDNRRFLIVPVQETIEVLLVEGRPDQDRPSTAESFLTAALESSSPDTQEPSRANDQADSDRSEATVSPRLGPRERNQKFHLDTIAEGVLAETSLAAYDTVLLANVAQLTTAEAKALDRYVQQGGELVIFLGAQVLAERYNQTLQDLLPAKLDKPITLDTPPRLDPLGYKHPIVAPFRPHPEAGLLTIPIHRLIRLSVKDHSSTQVVLATEEGDPVIVERRVGSGRVILVATSADTSWTLAPIWPSFVPLIQKMVSLGYESSVSRLNLTVAQPITGMIDSGEHPSVPIDHTGRSEVLDRLRFTTPDERRLPLKIAPDHPDRWCFDRTELAGIYTLQESEKASPSGRFAVNINPAESNLAKLSKATLQNDVWPGVRFVYRATTNDTSLEEATPIEVPTARGNPTPRRLFLFTLLLLALETCWVMRAGVKSKR